MAGRAGTIFAHRVGRNIRRTRQAAGLSKAELADRAGAHWTVVVAYEGGQGVPILETFVGIAMALGVSPCELLPGLEWDPKGYSWRPGVRAPGRRNLLGEPPNRGIVNTRFGGSVLTACNPPHVLSRYPSP